MRDLPIKTFKKRDSDERRTEGSGNSRVPQWVLEEQELKLRSGEFVKVMQDAILSIDDREAEFGFIPIVLNLEINDKAIAKSYRNAIKKIFNVNNKSNIIGFSNIREIIVKVDSKKDADAVKCNLEAYSKNKVAISAIDEICKFQPNILVDSSTENVDDTSFKIGLVNYFNRDLNRAVRKSFEHYCSKLSIELKKVNYSPEIILYKTQGLNKIKLDKIKDFIALESLSFMPKYTITLDGSDSDVDVAIKLPEKNKHYPTVGILDSGISSNSYLSPWITKEKFSAYPEEYVNKGHGTFVSGVLLYGDSFEKKRISGLDGCKLFDATVFPQDSIDEDELIDNVRCAISRNKEIKIWNMSLGTNAEVNDNSFSDIGIALDNIQDTFNVLICKSAGNCNNFMHNLPASRISRSADSIRSLVVGSVAHKKSVFDVSEINSLSPFSRVGYAPAGIIKPELVSYGGNAGINKNGKVVQTGVNSFSVDGEPMTAVGTSFSTPRVTSLVAALAHNISADFNPNLLKALVIHSSKYPVGLSLQEEEKRRSFGFGLPAPVDEIIYNNPHEITLIQQDKLVRGEFFEIPEFPFPEDLVDSDGFFRGEIKITLVTSSILNEKQGAEYCQSNIDVYFGTYDKLKKRDVSKPTISNEIGFDNNKNLLNQNLYSRHCKRDISSSFSNERMLLAYGKKYQPIKKWVIDLNEMTSGNRNKYLKTPKKWYLKIQGLYRNFSETQALIDGEELSQDFCLIVTIKDNKQEKMVYDSVSKLLSTRNFIHADIKLREQIRTKI